MGNCCGDDLYCLLQPFLPRRHVDQPQLARISSLCEQVEKKTIEDVLTGRLQQEAFKTCASVFQHGFEEGLAPWQTWICSKGAAGQGPFVYIYVGFGCELPMYDENTWWLLCVGAPEVVMYQVALFDIETTSIPQTWVKESVLPLGMDPWGRNNFPWSGYD